MPVSKQIDAWVATAGVLQQLIESQDPGPWREKFDTALRKAELNNPWFTRQQVETAFTGMIRMIDPDKMFHWGNKYTFSSASSKNVGVIMAGNIPMVGFHDLVCVLLSGHRLVARLSNSDKILLPFVTDIFHSFYPEISDQLVFSEQLKGVDAVIATGSNNTSRYFEYYFGKLPHIFRKNRNSAAVITGTENEFDFLLLGRDIFTYFGLGCRSVSKLFVPEGYSFDAFFQGILGMSDVMQHTRYMHNFDYHQALYLLNRQDFLTNNFLIVIQSNELASPVGVLYFDFYKDESDLDEKLRSAEGNLQCVVRKNSALTPGQSQFPSIDDYADGVDTMDFLQNL